jgi:hypothetical protein
MTETPEGPPRGGTPLDDAMAGRDAGQEPLVGGHDKADSGAAGGADGGADAGADGGADAGADGGADGAAGDDDPTTEGEEDPRFA